MYAIRSYYDPLTQFQQSLVHDFLVRNVIMLHFQVKIILPEGIQVKAGCGIHLLCLPGFDEQGNLPMQAGRGRNSYNFV